jgi:kinesin family protein 1
MTGNQTFIDPPEETTQQKGRSTERKTMAFSFDKSYWSAGPKDEPGYCSQQTLFDDLGKELLDHSFAGFNACIIACESNTCSNWCNSADRDVVRPA